LFTEKEKHLYGLGGVAEKAYCFSSDGGFLESKKADQVESASEITGEGGEKWCLVGAAFFEKKQLQRRYWKKIPPPKNARQKRIKGEPNHRALNEKGKRR